MRISVNITMKICQIQYTQLKCYYEMKR